MDKVKDNLPFLFSGLIVAICVIALIVMAVGVKPGGNKTASHTKKTLQKDNSNDSNASTADSSKSDTLLENLNADNNIIIQNELSEQGKAILADMSVDTKVAQLFMITPDDLTGVDNATIAGDTTKQSFIHYPVGALVYKKNNLLNTNQTKDLLRITNQYSQENIHLPLFTAVFEDTAGSSTINGKPEFTLNPTPTAKAIGQMNDADIVQNGSYVGQYLKELGFNMNISPNANISDDDNSFGNDAEVVSKAVSLYYKGLNEHGLINVLRDFPGSNEIQIDENGISFCDKKLSDLQAKELIPFNNTLGESNAVMLNSLAYPQITSSSAPAFMSKKMVQEYLRDELKFNGLVLTPPLNSENLQATFSDSEMAILAIESGCDIICEPSNFYLAYEAVLNAVNSGRISEDRLNESIIRIIKAKENYYR